MNNDFVEAISTTVAVEGHTESVEIIVNGKRLSLMEFDARTSLFGDLLVNSIKKSIEGCMNMCDNERLNTVTEYRTSDNRTAHWFNY